MGKKIAYLVTFEVKTRVVVDVDKNLTDKDPNSNDGLFADIVDTATEQIERNGVWDYLTYDNVTEIVEDTECPAE